MPNIKETWLASIPIAHRGLYDKRKPENSLPAFQAAVEHRYPIELDIQLTADDVIVVFHDYSLKRMTGESRWMKDVLSGELSSLFLLNTNYTIPTLEQVFELVDGKVPLLIEIKSDGKAGKLEEILVKRLQNYKGEFAIQSFNPLSILAVKKMCPNFIVGQLLKDFTKLAIKNKLKNCLLRRMVKPDFIAYRLEDIPNKTTNKAQKRNLLLLGWTIKNKKQQVKAIMFCDNYIFEQIRP